MPGRHVLVTGGSGVLGRALVPRLRAAGDRVEAPRRGELDLFDAGAVRAAVRDTDAVVHLATRIPARARAGAPGAWEENDRLRAVAARLLVDAALASATEVYVQPSVVWLDPGAPRPELASALEAERQAERFVRAGRRGVVVRLGLLHGPGTGLDHPDERLGATLHVDDAGAALADALVAPSGTYVVAGGPALRRVS